MDDVKRTERLDVEVDAELIGAVREIARQQGRDVGSLIEEALTDLVAKMANPTVRSDVMAIYRNI
jgi:predicted transcriptional regulator